jgi:osmotically-inducible protein OsmY
MPQQFTLDEMTMSTASDVLCGFSRDGIVMQAYRRLRSSSYRELQKIVCDFQADVLTLRGCVGSYFVKQMAFALVADVGGVAAVSNRLDVGGVV